MSVIGLVVISSIWLAVSLPSARQAPNFRMAQSGPTLGKRAAGMQLVAFPAERAASAAGMSLTLELR
ncbi:MAG: hypothetical protein ABW005_06755 [Burkholderiaceae bacterium]